MSTTMRDHILRSIQDAFDMSESTRNAKKIKTGFAGRMNEHSGFMARDTRGRTIDLDRSQWSRVYNTYEGSGQ